MKSIILHFQLIWILELMSGDNGSVSIVLAIAVQSNKPIPASPALNSAYRDSSFPQIASNPRISR